MSSQCRFTANVRSPSAFEVLHIQFGCYSGAFEPPRRNERATKLVANGRFARKVSVLDQSLAARIFSFPTAVAKMLNQSVAQKQDVGVQ